MTPGPTQSESERRIGELVQQQRWDEAESLCLELVRTFPDGYAGWLYLGILSLHKSQLEAAEIAFQKAADLNPQDAACWHNLGGVLRLRGRGAAAEACARRAIALNGATAAYWVNLGDALYFQSRCDEASDAYRQALALQGLEPETWRKLGLAEEAAQRLENAEQAFRACLALAPGYSAAGLNLASLLLSRGSLAEAAAQTQELIADDPQNADAWSMLGKIEHGQAHREQADKALRLALTLRPDPHAHSRLLHSMQYAEDSSPKALLSAHRQWDDLYARPLLPVAPAATGLQERLHIGFVCANTGLLPTACLVLPAIERLNTERTLVTCYSDRLADDPFNARLARAAHVCRFTGGLADEVLAEQIRDDKIDILVDLAGHAGSRLLVFARRPARVQMTWLGYVGTTGLTAMDFLLADRFHVPPGEDEYYAERVLRLPHDYACYQAPPYAPDVAPLPALCAGKVTFGCFNHAAKYSSGILDAWAEILRRVPSATLLLKSLSFGEPAVRADFRGRLAQRGIQPERVELEGWSPPEELMSHYGRIDLALDTQPYSGGLTTCEALWMGVPVITFPGQTFAGRHAVSHLTNAGYPQFVAPDAAGYVELAVRWANGLDELAAVRSTMRDRVRRSPLCNVSQFAHDLLDLFQVAAKGNGNSSRSGILP